MGTDISAVAEEAFIYGFPIIMGYGAMYELAVDTKSSQFKAPFNTLNNEDRVFTPSDTAVITPNSDTPYSNIWMDLRAEPMVLCVPQVDKGRYYSVQLVDLYTTNYGYIGSRATGGAAGCYMIAGPDWNGSVPQGIDRVFRCETQFSLAVFRTQLFGPLDIANVKKVQAGYSAQTLSKFLKQPDPPTAASIDFPHIDQASAKADPISYLNFLLQFCPAVPAERALRASFASIGVEADRKFDLSALPADQKMALIAGIKSGMDKIEKKSVALGTQVNGWRTGLNSGSRDFYDGDWLRRAAVALAGIYANDSAEALYPVTHTDSAGAKLNGADSRYTVTFPAGQLPPVNSFWSVTMYDGKSQLLVANPINRYLINSPMLPQMKNNTDGSLTIYIQQQPPADNESNWLPAPSNEFYLVMRLYWPKENALNGEWKPPAVQSTG